MASKSRSKADTQFILTLQMLYDYNYIKLHHWRKNEDFPHNKVKMILMKNMNRSGESYNYNRYVERYIVANLDYSIYYTNVVWYKSVESAIFIKVLHESTDDTEENYMELIKLNPKDLSAEFNITSKVYNYIESDGISYETRGSLAYIFSVFEEDGDEALNFYNINGKLIKSISVKILHNNYKFDTDTEEDKKPSVSDVLLTIRKISENKLLISDELIEFNLKTGDIINKTPWGIDNVCKTYEISVSKESLEQFESGTSKELEISTYNTYGNNVKNVLTSVIFNRYTGNFFLYRNEKTMYKITYKDMYYISGSRIIEIMKFIGSDTSLELAESLASLRVSDCRVSAYLDVLKLGETPEENLYSDADILNIRHKGGYYGYNSYNKNTELFNELMPSIRYFISNRMENKLIHACRYKAEIVNLEEFNRDIAQGMKTYEIRVKADLELINSDENN